jgi:2-C-methyl-D-erythritol 2,4-cyclodiphosphate synthase
MRVGQGFDVHRFSDDPERALVLGGVVVAEHRGLDGHSDADVLAHAVGDALLGAAGLGDLGTRFGTDDPLVRGASSLSLLAQIVADVQDQGFRVTNVDATVICETPRLSGLRSEMAARLSSVVEAPVSVKATTMERLGPIGASEGVAAMAVALLEGDPT